MLNSHKVDNVELYHAEIVAVHFYEVELKSMLDRCYISTSFSNGWEILKGRYPVLCQFAGGLFQDSCKVSPPCYQVFHNIGWEYDVNRSSRSGIS